MPQASTPQPAGQEGAGRRVAIIGPLDDIASDVSGFAEQLGLEPVIIGNPPGTGAAVSLDKLDELRELDFAILLPAEAEDAAASLLAIGFLLAVLGRQRICFVAGESAGSLPALDGALKVTMDGEGGMWRLLLAREMRRAGLDVDLNLAL